MQYFTMLFLLGMFFFSLMRIGYFCAAKGKQIIMDVEWPHICLSILVAFLYFIALLFYGE